MNDSPHDDPTEQELLTLLLERAQAAGSEGPGYHELGVQAHWPQGTCMHPEAEQDLAWRGPTIYAAALAACIGLGLVERPATFVTAEWPMPVALTQAEMN